jgi:hypothetical protein
MAFSKKPIKKDYPNTTSGQRAYDKAMRKWKSEGTTQTNKRSLAKEEQIKVSGKWVDKADWTKKTEESLKIKPKFKNQGDQFTHSDTFAFKDKKKQKEYETGLAKIKSKETSGVGPVKSGAEYAKKLKGATKGVGPVKDGDTYAKGIKKSKEVKKSSDLKIDKSNVFTKHYKTGKALGVMTRNQRRAYDKAAAADKKKNRK